jgi:hypothetical protein
MKPTTGTKRVKNNKRIPALDKYCIFSFAVLILYTIVEQVISSITGITHDVLTTCLFGVFGGELLLLAMIKRLKLKKEDYNGETYK